MKLHDLGPAEGGRKSRKRVARGNAGAGGTYAGRGRKGQAARSGGTKAPYFEGGQLPFVRRLPYRRGFTNVFRVEYTPVNLSALEGLFDAGAEVTPEALVAAGLLHRASEPFKILGHEGLTKALVVSAPRFSAAARQAILDAGGSCHDLADDYARPGMGRRYDR
jgi:large subunit ribosomal protein L15